MKWKPQLNSLILQSYLFNSYVYGGKYDWGLICFIIIQFKFSKKNFILVFRVLK